MLISARITSDLLTAPRRLKHPERVIDFGGQVIGAAISPEEDTLYVNVRKWPTGTDSTAEQINELLPIAEDVEVHVVDLATMEVADKVRLPLDSFIESGMLQFSTEIEWPPRVHAGRKCLLPLRKCEQRIHLQRIRRRARPDMGQVIEILTGGSDQFLSRVH